MKNNVERFSGFEDTYDRYRPEAPLMVPRIVGHYLQREPGLVVDLGCGTGLSTFIWRHHAGRVIGIEPNADMIGKAREKLHKLKLQLQEADGEEVRISFEQGVSNKLELEDGSADVVTCSQSFHWMEPVSTLREVSRVLADGGVFAAYDCDWPPTASWEIEQAYMELIEKSESVIASLTEQEQRAAKWSKEHHLQRMRDSQVFRYVKEIVFHHIEKCDAQRYVGLALSQGNVQTVFKLGKKEMMEADLEAFTERVNRHFDGRTLDMMFSYRMRLGVK